MKPIKPSDIAALPNLLSTFGCSLVEHAIHAYCKALASKTDKWEQSPRNYQDIENITDWWAKQIYLDDLIAQGSSTVPGLGLGVDAVFRAVSDRWMVFEKEDEGAITLDFKVKDGNGRTIMEKFQRRIDYLKEHGI